MDIVWVILLLMLALVVGSGLLCASVWIWYWTRRGWRWVRLEEKWNREEGA